MDNFLIDLWKNGKISSEMAYQYAFDEEYIKKQVR